MQMHFKVFEVNNDVYDILPTMSDDIKFTRSHTRAQNDGGYSHILYVANGVRLTPQQITDGVKYSVKCQSPTVYYVKYSSTKLVRASLIGTF